MIGPVKTGPFVYFRLAPGGVSVIQLLQGMRFRTEALSQSRPEDPTEDCNGHEAGKKQDVGQ